jgi:hypothetical protein
MTGQGLTMLDLGKGDELYQELLSNTHIPLRRGSLARDRIVANLDGVRGWPRDQVMKVALESPTLRRRARATLARVGALRQLAWRRSAAPTRDGRGGVRRRHVE